MNDTLVAAAITGVITLVVGFWGGKTLINNNITISADGKSITFNDKDIESLLSDNEKLSLQVQSLNDKLNKEQTAQPQIDMMNGIRLIIDSAEVGNAYSGFVQNGEVFLPYSAIGDYCKQNIFWDSATKTVYVGEKETKVAKEITLWNKPYLDVGNTRYLIKDEENSAIGFELDLSYNDDLKIDTDKLVMTDNYIVYPLNGKAVTAKGQFFIDFYNDHEDVQIKASILNENDEIIYTSPILTTFAPQLDFEIDAKDLLQLKIKVESSAPVRHSYSDDFYIRNLTVLSSDY